MLTPPSIYKYAERTAKQLREANDEIDKLLLLVLAQGDIIDSQSKEIEDLTEKKPEQFFTDVDK
jgi:hypothetical protein